MINKVAGVIGTSIAIVFLLGVTITLNKSPMISRVDIIPVYLIMGVSIFMMCVELYHCLTDQKEKRD
jgi:hypothetical protein